MLGTSVIGFVALFWTIGLPNLTHPLFDVEGFDRASVDRFWLAIDFDDPQLDRAHTTEELLRLAALRVTTFGPVKP